MEWDYERKAEKIDELHGDIKNALKAAGLNDDQLDASAKEFMTACIRVSPPEKERVIMHLVTMAPSGRGGGRSTKSGNIKLNVRSLFVAVSSGVFTVISITQTPWVIPFAAILLWNSIWKNMRVTLTESEAVTLWVMWQLKDSNKLVLIDDIKPAIDNHAEKYERSTLTEGDIKHSIKQLQSIGCIKAVKGEPNKWWLCERISPSYK